MPGWERDEAREQGRDAEEGGRRRQGQRLSLRRQRNTGQTLPSSIILHLVPLQNTTRCRTWPSIENGPQLLIHGQLKKTYHGIFCVTDEFNK